MGKNGPGMKIIRAPEKSPGPRGIFPLRLVNPGGFKQIIVLILVTTYGGERCKAQTESETRLKYFLKLPNI